ncbi:MAG: hypothetical protein KJI69_03285 [Patescibacteria group bacterium]|nr:hypothetical protein [Patescibacteria group bacterium]
MMRKTNQTDKVVHEVERLLDAGLTNKDEIIHKVIEETGVPRPTIRRILRDMRDEMLRKVRILQSEIDV